ncbi:MAG TPA: VCBS repeat-containing protein, partial [Gemmata sp.]|nr:VCBS repeat-containing protein [Gemmata sp.]
WVDLDGDGWEDLILDSKVYRNEGGAHFADYTKRSSLNIPLLVSAIVVADYDHDGKLDLYLTRAAPPGNLSWLEGRSNDARGNLLIRNLGNWQFEDVTKKSGTRGGYRSTFTAAWLDANDDGWPDLHVPNEFGDGVLLINNHDGTFKPHSLADHPVDFGTMGLAAGDVDNDGHIDIYCSSMYSKAGTRVIGNLQPDAYPDPVMQKLRRLVAGSQLHLNKGGLKFDHVGVVKQLAAVGWAYGAALADLDGDGFLDIYATAGYMSRDRSKPDE